MLLKKAMMKIYGKQQDSESKIIHERLYYQNDNAINCAEARLNFLRNISELKTYLGADDDS
jgi:hypothetical protein